MTTAPVLSIRAVEERIAPLRSRLSRHPVYTSVRTISHLRTFMESHVFAVWDFMSLLKALQRELTCVSIPWHPTRWPDSRRFINEIVLGEESDLFDGRSISHFELYLEAMEEIGADTSTIRQLLRSVEANPNAPFQTWIDSVGLPPAVRRFSGETFRVIESGDLSALAAAFTFGREDAIPDMFRQLVRHLDRESAGSLSKFIWYLERHIELDGDDHGPLSLRMVADLCGDDEERWEDASVASEAALHARLALWDAISDSCQLPGGVDLEPKHRT